MSAKMTIRVTVNGRTVERDVEPRLSLGDFLREEMHLTGTHLGCEHGICGACTVLLNGDSVRSCLTFAVQADGAQVTTVEGLGSTDALSPLQAAFRRNHALQCGFCTPGMLMTAMDLMAKDTPPTEADVRDALSGNLCRCTGYEPIVKAVLETMAESAAESGAEAPAGAAAGAGEGSNG